MTSIQSDAPRCPVAVIGCGTVGGATCRLLIDEQAMLSAKLGVRIELRYVVDVRFDHARSLGIEESLLCDDIDKALQDPEIQTVVELVGGTTIARDFVAKALRAGKHVVTANKALLAHHGPELYALARDHGVSLAFEASCAGGIPILRALCDGLIANRIDAVYGIVNGTCNYILTQMTGLGQRYDEALAEAQRDGLAEADPTLDVGGGDSAHKLAIMAALGFGGQVDFDAIPVEGIDSLDLIDLRFGGELGYVVKLLAIATRHGQGVSLRVRPAFISREHPLAWVSGPFNAVSVYGHATGHTMYYGRGAGASPTASAVVADVASIALGTSPLAYERMGIWPDRTGPMRQMAPEEIVSRYYLRVMAEDQPGVLSMIARILAEREISISSVLQHEPPADSSPGVPVIITTHRAREGSIRDAMAEVDGLEAIKARTVCIAIVDEHPESL
jgi:homoserine dehydrogenase